MNYSPPKQTVGNMAPRTSQVYNLNCCLDQTFQQGNFLERPLPQVFKRVQRVGYYKSESCSVKPLWLPVYHFGFIFYCSYTSSSHLTKAK
jgi:hypothetical protein